LRKLFGKEFGELEPGQVILLRTCMGLKISQNWIMIGIWAGRGSIPSPEGRTPRDIGDVYGALESALAKRPPLYRIGAFALRLSRGSTLWFWVLLIFLPISI
jgi:hypothetical protein